MDLTNSFLCLDLLVLFVVRLKVISPIHIITVLQDDLFILKTAEYRNVAVPLRGFHILKNRSREEFITPSSLVPLQWFFRQLLPLVHFV